MGKVLSEKEKRGLVDKVLEIDVKVFMKNHMYQFGGETMVQQEGGSIELVGCFLSPLVFSRIFSPIPVNFDPTGQVSGILNITVRSFYLQLNLLGFT